MEPRLPNEGLELILESFAIEWRVMRDTTWMETYLRLNWRYRNINPGCRKNCRAWIKQIRAARQKTF